MKKTITTKRKVKANLKVKAKVKTKAKSKVKYPTSRFITLPDGTKHIVFNLGYKTNAVQMVRDSR